MLDYVRDFQYEYGSKESPKVSITGKDNQTITSTYATHSNVVTTISEKKDDCTITKVFKCPLDCVSLCDTNKKNTIKNATEITATIIDNLDNRNVTTHYYDSYENYSKLNHKKTFNRTVENVNGVDYIRETTETFDPNTKTCLCQETFETYSENGYFLQQKINTFGNNNITRNFIRHTILENTTHTGKRKLSFKNYNFKTEDIEISFTNTNNSKDVFFKDKSHKYFVKNQSNTSDLLDSSSRIVKNGDKEEFLIEDDQLIFASGEFLNILKAKDIIDEDESIQELTTFADNISYYQDHIDFNDAESIEFSEDLEQNIVDSNLDDFIQ